MRNRLIIILCCFITSIGFSQNPGDTIIVEAFNYNSTTRDTVIQFPSNNLSYEKIIMLYNMRCKNNLVSNSANPNQGCGEWDYSCNTYIEDSTYVDSVLAKIKSHAIAGFNGSTYDYSISPVYDYWEFNQNSVVIDSIINEDTLKIHYTPSSYSSNIISTNQNSFKSQFLYKRSEFDTSILSPIDTLKGISINVANSNQHAQFLSVRLKLVNDSVLDKRNPHSDGLTEVYHMNTFLDNGQNRLDFKEPFILDSISNLLVEFSLTNSIANDSSWVECHSIANMALFTSDSKHLFLNEAENIHINNNLLSSISDEITISMWINGNENILPKNTSILEGLDSVGNRAINIHLPWSNSNIYWDCGNNGTTYDRISSYTDESNYSSSWNHWAFTKNANTGEMKIYLNGNILQSGTGKILPINIESIYLGSNAFESNYWSGKIKEIQIFNTELEQDTIRDWMNIRLNNNHPNYSNLITHYPINEGNGSYINDNSGTNISSNIIGNPNWSYSRGVNLNFFFEEQNLRPNITFYSGEYTYHDTIITVYDSIISPPNLVNEYQVFPMYNSGFENDSTGIASSNYYWQSNMYDNNGNLIGAGFMPQIDGTINIDDLFYYTRSPMLFQIMSFVTPYGLFLDLGDNGKTWEFNLTDFTPIMNGKKRLIMNAGGQWQEEMEIKFIYIVGTPTRDIINIQQLWKVQSRNYIDILSDYAFEPRSMLLDNNTDALKVRTMITGHGQEGEFIPRQHSLYFDNSNYASWQVWTECSNNPIYPQGGTWPIDRAGWCPGQATDLREDFISNFSAGQTHVFDYSINTGSGDSRYYVSSQLVNYGPPNFQINAAIKSIISPSLRPEFIRENPICNNPKIEIANYGELTLTSLDIEYEMKGGTTAFFSWNGSLEHLESEIIQLPSFAFDGDENVFNVRILNPNGSADEQSTNDFLSSKFEETPNYPNEFRLELQTNNFASENSWTISDMQGNSVLWNFNLNNNQTTLENISLDDGCYVFELFDNGQNGLDFWFTNATTGTGTAKFIQNWPPNPSFPVVLNTFEPDFGSSIKHFFTVGNPIFTNSIEIRSHTSRVFPNPSNGQFTIEINPEMIGAVNIKIYNILNEIVLTKNIVAEKINFQSNFDLSKISNGTYFITIENEIINETIKLIISQ